MVLNYFILLSVFICYNQAILRNIKQATGPPYLAHIVYDYPICFGSIITDISILTARDCIPSNPDFRYRGKVLAGTRHEVTANIKDVGYTLKDPEQDPMNRNNFDLAVITLREPLIMSKSIQPIPLYKISENTKSTKKIAYGYVVKGLMNRVKGRSRSSSVQFKPVQYLLGQGPACDEFKAEDNRIDAEEFCVGFNSTEKRNDQTGLTMGAPIIVDGKLFSVQTCCNGPIPKLNTTTSRKRLLGIITGKVVKEVIKETIKDQAKDFVEQQAHGVISNDKKIQEDYGKEGADVLGSVVGKVAVGAAVKASAVTATAASAAGLGSGMAAVAAVAAPIAVAVAVVGVAYVIIKHLIPPVVKKVFKKVAYACVQVYRRVKSFFKRLFGK